MLTSWPEAMDELDRYILHRLQVLEHVSRAYDNTLHVVFHAIHNFCVIELSNFYFDVIMTDSILRPPERAPQRANGTVRDTADAN